MSKQTPKTIFLIVEDEPALSELFFQILEDEGHQVIICNNGEAALALIRETPPDIILLDLNLPGMSGNQVLENLSEINPEIPVIITSAYVSNLNLTPQVKEILEKPFSIATLLETVRKYIA